MKTFLKIFGVEDGNYLSPFYVDMDSPGDIIKLIEYLFRPPKRHPKYKTKYNDAAVKTDDSYEEAVDATPPGEIVSGFVEDIQSLDLG